MSSVGTLASIGGGLVMGTALFASLIAENVKCREQWAEIVIPLLAWGAVAGGLGSLVCNVRMIWTTQLKLFTA